MRELVPAVAVAALLVLSGCMTANVDAAVDADGTVTAYDVELEMQPTVYDGLRSRATQEGYDSVESYLLADVNVSRMGNYTYEQRLSDGNVTIHLRFVDWNPGPESDVSTTVSDGNVSYEDRTFVTVDENSDVAVGDGVAVRYRLTMPADISASNADVVANETAVWEYEAGEPIEEPVRATSPAPTSAFGPGLGVPVALVALLATVVLARRL